MVLRIGSVDSPLPSKPVMHIWTSHKAGFFDFDDGLPRVLEARGLDVTPGMIERLEAVGDRETVAALDVILAEEMRHVEIGTHWFRHCCREQGLDPIETFLGLLREYYERLPRGPFNLEARYEAGFTEAEMAALTAGPDSK